MTADPSMNGIVSFYSACCSSSSGPVSLSLSSPSPHLFISGLSGKQKSGILMPTVDLLDLGPGMAPAGAYNADGSMRYMMDGGQFNPQGTYIPPVVSDTLSRSLVYSTTAHARCSAIPPEQHSHKSRSVELPLQPVAAPSVVCKMSPESL